MTPLLFFYARAALAWTNNVHLEMRNLKQTELSETEEKRKERLRIKREKERARRRLRNTKPRLELRSPHNV